MIRANEGVVSLSNDFVIQIFNFAAENCSPDKKLKQKYKQNKI